MDRVETIFHQSLELEGFDERRDVARRACGADRALMEQVERLLLLHEEAERRFPSEPGGGRAAISPLLDECALTEGAGTRIGRYKLLERLGEGGFGSVWAAEQREPVRRRVAFKIIKLGMDTQQVVARFEAERQALALMDHPNIAKVLDAGATDSGRPFFVMELVKGIAITQYCDQEELSATARLELFIKVCHAAQHAHQKGIIHRDIKPSNVMVTLHDGVPVPKVIDFGIAKATEQELTEKTIYTRYGQFIGTPAYMSPEQAEMSGLDVDTRSDIYSLGVLLYELLTGQTPFDSTELMQSGYEEMRRTICEREPIRPSTKVAKLESDAKTATARRRSSNGPGLISLLRGDLDWIVMNCLEKDRSRRYDTANGLALDIKRYLSDEPIQARPPSAGYRLQKAWRRNRTAFTVAMAFGVIILLALALSSWSFLREREARMDEARQGKEALQYAESWRRTAYTSDMGYAMQAIEQGDLGLARKILDRNRPRPDQADIRGFEWRYLWSRSRSQENAFLGRYRSGFGGLAISPDGGLLASVDEDIVVRTFPDGTVVKTMRFDKLVDTYRGPIVRFSPDGHYLLAEDADGAIRLWDTGTWEEQPRLEGLSAPFAFVSEGTALAAWAGDHLAIWNTTTWKAEKQIEATIDEHHFAGQSLATSPDGDTLFRGGDFGSIHSWDLIEDRELEPLDTDIPNMIPCLAVSSRGILAVAHFTGQVTLWDIHSRQRRALLENHRSWVSTVAFSSDGSMLLSASADRTIAIYDVNEDASSVTLRRRLLGHAGEIWAMAISPDDRRVCSGSNNDGTLRLWGLDGKSIASSDSRMRIPLEFTASGKGLIGWSDRSSLLELAIESAEAVPLKGMPEPLVIDLLDNLVWPMDSYHPLKNRLTPGRWVARATAEGLEIWNLQAGELEKRLSDPGIHKQAFSFSDDGSLLATASVGMGVRVWNTSDWTSKQLVTDFKINTKTGLCFSPDNGILAVTSELENILIDLVSEKILMSLDTGNRMTMARDFSPDGKIFAAGTDANQIHFWNISKAEKRPVVLDGHLAGIRGLAFSPDGRTLVSCGDNRVKLWNVEMAQEFFTLQQAKGETAWPIFSPDGTCLVTATSEPSLHLWKAPSWEEIKAAESAAAVRAPGLPQREE